MIDGFKQPNPSYGAVEEQTMNQAIMEFK